MTNESSSVRSGRGPAADPTVSSSAGAVVRRWRRIRQLSAGYRPVGVNQLRTSASLHGELTLPTLIRHRRTPKKLPLNVRRKGLAVGHSP